MALYLDDFEVLDNLEDLLSNIPLDLESPVSSAAKGTEPLAVKTAKYSVYSIKQTRIKTLQNQPRRLNSWKVVNGIKSSLFAAVQVN